MYVLICTRREKASREERDGEMLRTTLLSYFPGATVLHDEDLDWPRIKMTSGGTSGAYRFVAASFPVIILVEGLDTRGYYVSRGQATIATQALVKCQSVGVWRENNLYWITDIRVVKPDDWSGHYAVAVF